jgi:hypothetical protein
MDTSTRKTTRLDSWKEIAAYLKRGARTVQRMQEASTVRESPRNTKPLLSE